MRGAGLVGMLVVGMLVVVVVVAAAASVVMVLPGRIVVVMVMVVAAVVVATVMVKVVVVAVASTIGCVARLLPDGEHVGESATGMLSKMWRPQRRYTSPTKSTPQDAVSFDKSIENSFVCAVSSSSDAAEAARLIGGLH